ncbi:uncharacterized protein B0H64DRAFT_456891 [Chaetomium fimeti]|uniref:Uncharacterized protein n=1 Tax=Chaetomium fimeti TaxID=1854472 RepID=A0AAE0LTL3_9PEZI|nr:hypothetical protein B0H64DRAFT_456891 [Chaetomium fimeti]
MFEVDWTDYDCERVGQRRARKELEREQRKNNDASSGHRTNSTISTRTSSSSDQHRRKFFGSIGRKKPAASLGSNSQEATTPKSESTKANGESKRGSLRFSGIAAVLMTPSTTNASTGLENKLPNIQRPKSMLSKMTQLTIPTLESQGDGSPTDATTAIKLVQALDDKGSFVDKVVETTYHQHGETDPFVSTLGTKITTGPRTPRKTRLSRVIHSTPSPEDKTKSASELIDDWFTALHSPMTRPAPKPGGLNGTIRSGGVLLPPNVVRRTLPETPTRPSAKKSNVCFAPPNPSPIRFSADNPDDWTPVAQRNREPSDAARARPARVKDQGSEQDEEEILRLMAADLKDIHIQEEVVRESRSHPAGE